MTNAVFLAVQMPLFIVIAWLVEQLRDKERMRVSLKGILVAKLVMLVTYYVVSPAIWSDPIGEMT